MGLVNLRHTPTKTRTPCKGVAPPWSKLLAYSYSVSNRGVSYPLGVLGGGTAGRKEKRKPLLVFIASPSPRWEAEIPTLGLWGWPTVMAQHPTLDR